MKVAVLGSGSMGVAISILLGVNNHDVVIWTPFQDEADFINENHGITDRLPGVFLKDDVLCTTDLELVIKGAELIVMAVPSTKMRETAIKIKDYVHDDTIIVSCSKGIEDSTCMVMSQILEDELPDAKIAALSGPSYAIEIAQGMPTAVVIASTNIDVALKCQNIFMNDNFRVYTSEDILGVEIGGALKNIIALAAGISDGLGYSDNTKAALLTRGITEISRLGVAMGAEVNTFFGLAGIGDLILTSTGKHSRNRMTGILIGQGMKVDDAIKEVKMVVEGVNATKPAYELGKNFQVELPIISEVYDILFNSKSAKLAVAELMGRDKKMEWNIKDV